MTLVPRRSVPDVGRGPTSTVAAFTASTAFAAFVALAALVRLGLLDGFDAVVRQWARPDDVWGDLQIRADLIVEGLRPPVLAVASMLFAIAVGLVRRSWRPLVLVALVGMVTAVVTRAAQLAVARPDPHRVVEAHGGSFPSGHVTTVAVGAGLAVILLFGRPRPWAWLLVGLVGSVMGVALLLQAAHWAADVIGGALLATALLGAVDGCGLGGWAAAVRLREP